MNQSFGDTTLNAADLDNTALSRLLARRIESLGGEPFASDKERYAVLIGDGSGEIVELGRPLRGSRLFPTKALRRNIALLHDLEAFASDQDVSNWRYWTIKTAGRKANPKLLKEELARFNKKINQTFTELRKKHSFKLILLAVHVRYDHFSGLFDLHAHLICEVAADVSEDVRVRLMTAFSETDVEDVPIRNLAAVVTYCLWGVYRPAEALTWPDHAIEAVWALHSGDSRPHLVRTGKAFQEWRRNRLASSKNARQSDELRRRRKNRRATRDPRSGTQTGDRLLAKTPIRIRDQEVLALIVEKAPKAPSTSAPRTSSSATVATTQSRPDGPSSGSVVRRKSRPKAKPLHQPPPASGSAPGGDRENVKPKRQKALPTCPEIPSRKQWWFNAWPSAHGGTTRLPGPIKRRLARLLTRSRPPDAG